jgi:hypothetical protein
MYLVGNMTLCRQVLSVVVLTLVAGVALGDIIKSGSLQASSDGVNITLHWITEDETGVLRYEVERSSGIDAAFMEVGAVDAKGASVYEFVDNSVFHKSGTLYQYRVKIIFANGAAPVYTSVVTVNHTVSGIRRTWGSIKAMFR